MIECQFLRLKRFLRWFFNASPDWSESRSQVNESVKTRRPDLENHKRLHSVSRDFSELESRSEKSRKDG